MEQLLPTMTPAPRKVYYLFFLKKSHDNSGSLNTPILPPHSEYQDTTFPSAQNSNVYSSPKYMHMLLNRPKY